MIAALVRFDVPVDPDAPTARRWAADELAKSLYHQGPTLADRLWDWLQRQLDQIGGVSDTSTPLIMAAIVVGLVIATLLVAGPVRRTLVRQAVAPPGVLDDDTRTAARIRADAQAAAAAGRFADATAEWFRAVVRDLEERALLDERPGRTADEAAVDAAGRLPGLAADLADGARRFDAVVYGHHDADAADEARLRELDQRVRRARPTVLAGTAR